MKLAVKSEPKRRRQATPGKESEAPIAVHHNDPADDGYRVGPGFPPREHQWRKGQSGNPTGKRKTPSIAPDLKALLEGALNAKVKLRRGERDDIVTKAEAGIEQLVDQFAKGDPHGRRDFILLCKTLGVDLTNRKALEDALADAVAAEDEALLEEYVEYRISERLGGGAHQVPALPKPECARRAGADQS